MTTQEFSDQFDLLYDNLASKSSPGLDNYDKSVLLTKAQLEIVKNKYNPRGNKYGRGFEQSEQRREALEELVRDYKATETVPSTSNLIAGSVFFKIPTDVMYIIYEEGKIASSGGACAGEYVDITPQSHDTLKASLKNPFRSPDELNGYRFNISEQDGNKVVEIYTEYPLDEYHFRYIMLPPPIILSDLDEEFVEENLTIDGNYKRSECILDEAIHQEILDRAVELAKNYYRDGDLKSTVQLNARNE